MSKKTKPRVYDMAGKQVTVADKSWYTLQASGEAEQRSIEIFVYGEIGAWGITANQFVQDPAIGLTTTYSLQHSLATLGSFPSNRLLRRAPGRIFSKVSSQIFTGVVSRRLSRILSL